VAAAGARVVVSLHIRASHGLAEAEIIGIVGVALIGDDLVGQGVSLSR
jgi:hypothetical protein